MKLDGCLASGLNKPLPLFLYDGKLGGTTGKRHTLVPFLGMRVFFIFKKLGVLHDESKRSCDEISRWKRKEV